ncbi:MAG TPA: hypothetical protein VF234_03950, partial [Limnochordia bacterium]
AGRTGSGQPPRGRSDPGWEPFPTASVIRAAADELALTFEHGGMRLRASIRLVGAAAALEFAISPLSWGEGAAGDVVFPGAIIGSGPSQAVVPAFQGLLYRGKEGPFEEYNPGGGLRMRWWGVIGERSSYLAIVETADDAGLYVIGDERGRVHGKVRWLASLGELAYERRVIYHFMPGVRSYVPLAKRFRAYARAHGLFRSLQDKAADRPALQRLLGAVFVFLGYQQGDGLDYLAGLRTLKAMGVERAFCFPFFFCNWAAPFVVQGVGAIAQRHLVDVVQRELGYLCSPWMWNFEILTRSPDYTPEMIVRRGDGRLAEHWRIDDDVWQVVNPRRAAELFKGYEAEFMLCDGFHFDVTTSHGLMEDRAPGRPMTRAEDREARTDLFRWLTDRGKVVGSEGFWDWAAPVYDYGTTKLAPHFGPNERYWTIPLLGLVYHDAVLHTWWEVDAYNERHPPFPGRGGQLTRQSLQDILFADPPLVFPIGRKNYWLDRRARRGIIFGQYNLDSAEVRRAVRRAVEVARIQRALAFEEMVSHCFLSPDGAVQETAFASGTRIAVNLSPHPAETADGQPIEPFAWRIYGNMAASGTRLDARQGLNDSA